MVQRHRFIRELDDLNNQLIKMGLLVEEAIDNAITALVLQDIELAQRTYDNDDIIDEMETRIEKLCLSLIAREHPLAKDLRTVTTALKMITDLERIADHASDISEITLRMTNEKYIKPLIDIPQMAKLSKQMVNDAINAYIDRDIELAYDVCKRDDLVDDLFDKIKIELANIIKNDHNAIDQIVNFLFISKYLERMADHATNIGEWVIYNITGDHNAHTKKY